MPEIKWDRLMMVGGLALVAGGVLGLVWLVAGGGGGDEPERVFLSSEDGRSGRSGDGEVIPTWTPGPTFDWSLATRVAESLVGEEGVAEESAGLPADADGGGGDLAAAVDLATPAVTPMALDEVAAEAAEAALEPTSAPTAVPTIGPAYTVPDYLLDDPDLPDIDELSKVLQSEYLPGKRDEEGELIWEEVELPIVLDRQTLFPLQSGVIPGEITEFEREAWPVPEPARYISRQTPYVMWGFIYKFPEEHIDYVFDGYVRWWEVQQEYEPVLMFEEVVELTDLSPGYLGGLSAKGGVPGLWRPGEFRVELVDQQYRTALHWEFWVR